MSYNPPVPTPFNHLAMAGEILSRGLLSEFAQEYLSEVHAAFLFGNTAPDYVVLERSTRESSHFFRVPMIDRTPAHLYMLKRYPALEFPSLLPPAQAAFIAGYLAHLWLDQAWIAVFFEPYFGPDVTRGNFHHRLTDHNLLRAYVDRIDRQKLSHDLGDTLQKASPDDWLPFAKDKNLKEWRDMLAEQLKPGGESQTVEVFSSRLGVSSLDFAARLDSTEQMEKSVFQYLSQEQIKQQMKMWRQKSTQLINAYLQDEIGGADDVNRPFQAELVQENQYVGGSQ